jgi:aspartyl protease family protein
MVGRVSRLLKFAIFALVATASALGGGALVALSAAPLRAARAEAPALFAFATGPANASSEAIRKSSDGHYWAEGQVNSARVRFLVDTGATAVALTPADARRLGFDTDTLQYGYRVVTAGGQTRAAAVKLVSITVGGARVENVDALVIEEGLDASLLGMSYLGRLSGFEATRETLILRR